MRIWVDDLEPDLAIPITDPDSTVDVTTVPVKITGVLNGVTLFEDRLITDKTLADGGTLLVMPWQAGDTATPGRMRFIIRIYWPSVPEPQTIVPIRSVKIRDPFRSFADSVASGAGCCDGGGFGE